MRFALVLALVVVVCAVPFRAKVRGVMQPVIQKARGQKTVAERVVEFGAGVRVRLRPEFERVGVTYPPQRITLVGIKQEKVLEVWVNDPAVLLKRYPMLGASGVLGPKLQEGDLQVPEGLYRIESLNPNSLYHLALRVNYPNSFDRIKGKLDGREDLGCDIMIHGSNGSVGCLAMGDQAAEELFVLAAETGIEKILVILTPVDFRRAELPQEMPRVPEWTPELYEMVRQALGEL